MGKNYRAPVLRVNVTSDIIEQSKKRDSGYCMIAEAVKAAFPDAQYVAVDIQTIRLSDPRKGLRYTYLTPRVAQVALVDYDQGESPEPFYIRLYNGQVTRMSSKPPKATEPVSDEEKEIKRSLTRDARKSWAARLSPRTVGVVPDKIGGQTPPKAPLSRRRAFGLRALER